MESGDFRHHDGRRRPKCGASRRAAKAMRRAFGFGELPHPIACTNLMDCWAYGAWRHGGSPRRRQAAAAACLTLASLPLTFLNAPLAVGATLALTGLAVPVLWRARQDQPAPRRSRGGWWTRAVRTAVSVWRRGPRW
ncbi:hypothetical protein GCM10010307_50390 [Streptomyces vastus]|uniref:Uncharacterized protein n=1 Tax=Streptomyces vastus TaxID=285451 RepID=A0ABN3R7E5_9ACTN